MAVTAERTARIRGSEQARVQNSSQTGGQLSTNVNRMVDTPCSGYLSSQKSTILDTGQGAAAGDLGLSVNESQR